MKGKDKDGGEASGSNDAPKKNHVYTLHSKGEQESSPDVVTGMLNVFSIYVYALLYPCTTLYFVTSLVAKKFVIFPDILNEPFMVSTPIGESVVAKMVYRNNRIMLPSRVIHVELVELDVFDFDAILGMDWLHACFASIYCITRLMKFNFPNEPLLEWKGEIFIPRGLIISC